MDELIVKYLTDKLDTDDTQSFVARLENDADYRNEIKLTAVALAIADFSLDFPETADIPDIAEHDTPYNEKR